MVGAAGAAPYLFGAIRPEIRLTLILELLSYLSSKPVSTPTALMPISSTA